MKSARRQCFPTAQCVHIRASDGLIGVAAPCLFAELGDTAVHAMIERLLHLETVRAVRVDRVECTVAIEYDHSDLPAAAALARFAEAIGSGGPNGPSALGDFLKHLPGQVRRVERPIGRGSTPAETCPARPDARCPSGRASRIVRSGELLVEYDQAPEGRTAPADRSAMIRRVPPPAPFALLHQRYLTDPFRRAMNLAAAGGCFAMSIIGLLVPGIPTVPFVLATSYFLARSSPALHERFRRSRVFGTMVRDWEQYGGLQLGTKLKLVAVTFVIIGVTIAIAGASPPILIVMGVVTAVSMYIVVRIPTISESSRSAGAPYERHPAISSVAVAGT